MSVGQDDLPEHSYGCFPSLHERGVYASGCPRCTALHAREMERFRAVMAYEAELARLRARVQDLEEELECEWCEHLTVHGEGGCDRDPSVRLCGSVVCGQCNAERNNRIGALRARVQERERAQVALVTALRRTDRNLMLAVRGRPVRDVDENRAENAAALKLVGGADDTGDDDERG